MVKKSEVVVISGPPNTGSPFSWRLRKAMHKGIPENMNFKWHTFTEKDFKI